MRRIGFEGRTVLNRHDFGVSWQDELPGGGVLVSNEIALNLDVEAINDDDLCSVGQEAAIYEPRELPTEARAGVPRRALEPSLVDQAKHAHPSVRRPLSPQVT